MISNLKTYLRELFSKNIVEKVGKATSAVKYKHCLLTLDHIKLFNDNVVDFYIK